MEPVVLWFAVGGLGVLCPLVLIGVVLLRREVSMGVPDLWRVRLRFGVMTKTEWIWSVGALAVVGLLTLVTKMVLEATWDDLQLTPSFMAMEPLSSDRYWILGVWIPFFFLNILGEEFMWRGVILPRQEKAFGHWAWLANGVGWLLFHVAFGVPIMIMLWPIALIVPYVVQRRKNTSIGIVIHAGLNGPGFVATAFGYV